MRTLVAVDGSKQSEAALEAARHLQPGEATIVLHAIDVPTPAYPEMMPEVAKALSDAAEREMREEGERLLKRLLSAGTAEGPVTTRLEVGSPAECILAVAEQERIDLIVMGTRGQNRLQEVVLGSVAHRVTMHAACSTLIVNRPMPRLRSILLAVEGPDDAERAIRFLGKQPFRRPVEITVLTILPLAQPLRGAGVSDAASLREKALKSAWCFVWDVAARISGFHYGAGALVGMGAPAHAILQQAASIAPDLIMVGSHGKRGVTRFLLGSVSHAVVHGSSCPVLICR